MGIKKVGKEFENVGKAGSHGKFKTKAGARAQQRAMFENGYHIQGDRIANPHAEFKAKLHKAVSDAYDEHMKNLGLMEKHDEPGEVEQEPGHVKGIETE